jgi:hypothetical protein
MKVSEMIDRLRLIEDTYGDIPCTLQLGAPDDEMVEMILGYDDFFLVVEEYDDGQHLNIRSWPY